MEELLQEVGLTDGFLIPVANAENAALERLIKELKREHENLSTYVQDKQERCKAIKKHFQNLSADHDENIKLLYEYNCQVSTETETAKLWESHVRGLIAEEKDLHKELGELKNLGENYQAEKIRLSHRLQQLKALVQWDQDALQTWSSAAVRVGDDHAVLSYFSEGDQAKFEHLELRRQQLRQEVECKRRKFETINGDILSLEQSLEKLGQLYQNQQKERQALVDQWHESKRILQQREEEIRRVIEDVGSLRTQGKLRMRELEEHKTFLQNEQKNNGESAAELAYENRETRNSADMCRQLEADVADMAGQLKITRASLTSAARQVQNLRSTCRRMVEDIYLKRAQCELLQQSLDTLNRHILDTNNKKMSAEARARRLEDLRAQEELTNERLLVESSKSQEKVRELTEELARLGKAEQEQRNCMEGMEAAGYNLKQRISSALAELGRQEEMLYKAKINYMEKELLYKRMLGRADPENAERCEQELKKLEAAMADAKETNQLLLRENYRLDQEYRRVLAALELDEKEQKYVRTKREELELQAEVGKKQVAGIRTANQDSQVDENVVRLRVCHLEKSLKKVGSDLYTLEKQKLELEEAVKERAMEVDACLEVLSVRKRALTEQLGILNSNINAAKLKVEHLQTKHAVSMQSLGATDTGEEMSVTQLKIMAAQERYELQEMGDKLDAKIRTTEREITAMENTLQAVNASNASYKCSLSRVPTDGAELQEKAKLDAAYVEAVEQLRTRRAVLQELEEATTRIQDALQAQLEEEAKLLKEADGRASDMSEIKRRLEAQTEKQNRASREMKSVRVQLHGTQKRDHPTLEEKDISLREIRDQNQGALQQLSEVALRIMETGPVVGQYLRERGLSLVLPSARRSVASSRTSSVVAASSCYTIDSLTLGEAKAEESKMRRPSILKSDKKSTMKSSSKESDKRPNTIDIVDLVVPQTK